jgi:hypothetical protein
MGIGWDLVNQLGAVLTNWSTYSSKYGSFSDPQQSSLPSPLMEQGSKVPGGRDYLTSV